jgi:adenylate kinase family enzyme
MRVVLVIGLPASGKTTWAHTQVARLRALGVDARLLDDPRSAEELAASLDQECHLLFITDPHLCMQGVGSAAARRLEAQGHEVTLVFFANDPERCLVNAARRPDKSVARFIVQLAESYQLPDGVVGLPVYEASADEAPTT